MDDRMPSQPDRQSSGGPVSSPNARPRFPTTDPSNEKPGPVYEGHTRDEALVIAREVRCAWDTWRRTSFSERAGPRRRMAVLRWTCVSRGMNIDV
jgi:hypothetical protein